MAPQRRQGKKKVQLGRNNGIGGWEAKQSELAARPYTDRTAGRADGGGFSD
jgi:hypothetical protein